MALRQVRLLAARAAALPASLRQRPSRSPLSAPSRAQTQTAASNSSWAILASIPRVAAADGADVSLALTPPPRVSILTVSPRVFPEPVTPQHFPFVLAADPSGLLLLQATLGRPWTREATLGPDGYFKSVTWHNSLPRYFVLDPAADSASAFQLPDPDDAIMHQALLGLIASPAGYMVAELRPLIGSDKATLLCFSSETGRWVSKPVHYPLPPRHLAPINVLSLHGRLWWVDLEWGVITSDPFADHPVLRFVPFPPDRVLGCREAWGVADIYRCVGVSAGKLRFVDTMYMGPIIGGTPDITVWTLPGPDATEWTLEHQVSFGDIWADDTYKATGLPVDIPALALIHPDDPDIVYFFLEEHIFAVDVPARKVVDCKVYHLVAPPRCKVASRFVRAWKLPHPLPSGMLDWSNDPILTERDKAPHGIYPLEGHSMLCRETFKVRAIPCCAGRPSM
ncbi:uncharacterized protein [Lolium perenne]|uniref:uncharacterized protein n=1 Tax=Lolium perenne TaxID=4522 RepID=UPI0021F5275F|nr:uncharacterized protein LOC127342224 isoform X1 [Lolium perenne]XP_051224139.1 uncharacterized protein LOC127342224 isoform X2 [Lolium perenne]